MKKLALVLISFMVLAGCRHVVNGRVVEKRYKPEQIMFMPMMISCGKNCTSMLLIPYFLPPAWAIEVRGKDKDGKDYTETVWIEHKLWTDVRTGDEYMCGGEKMPQCQMERKRVRK